MGVTPLSDLSTAVLRTHQSNIVAAEQTRQSAIAGAGTGAAAAVTVRNADVAFYRSLLVSGVAAGIDIGNFQQALRLLGTGGT